MIKNLKSGDMIDRLDVLVDESSLAETKKGKPYVRMKVRDKTGELQCVKWEYDKEIDKPLIAAGKVVKIYGTIGEYAGNLQCTVSSLAPSTKDPMEFAKTSRFPVDEMWDELVNIVDGFEDSLTKYVAKEMLFSHEKVIDAFKKAPAARGVHNAWYGGLLEHVLSMTRIAEKTVEHYKKMYKAPISKDKVLFGVIMHDAGKIIEYDFSNPSFSTTGLGLLTNHIVLGPAWVYEKANKYNQAGKWTGTLDEFKIERSLLMHLIASHHGVMEWGSPVVPTTLEAIILHHIDNLDSKVMHALELIEKGEKDIEGFSEKSWIGRTSYFLGGKE